MVWFHWVFVNDKNANSYSLTWLCGFPFASYSVRVNASGYVQALGESCLTVELPAKEAYNRNENA